MADNTPSYGESMAASVALWAGYTALMSTYKLTGAAATLCDMELDELEAVRRHLREGREIMARHGLSL